MCHDWPKPPFWPEDLPLIRKLLSRRGLRVVTLSELVELATRPAGGGVSG